MPPRPPLPPFTPATALAKVRAAEAAWNTRDAARVAAAYTPDCVWRNRSEFIRGRPAIVAFLTRKWAAEEAYVLRKDLWAHTDDHIAVRFQYEYRVAEGSPLAAAAAAAAGSGAAAGSWRRAYGVELWAFTPDGLMARREASINDVPIAAVDRRLHGPRDTSPGAAEEPELPLE
ncbi:hypothetical protein I4F81_005551 [Pyropia yezoensis]|uniref:Uncharacterized protein n=1 Tax=Pyropia yezoensis TaxID=2788 RepID=A0ACC3BZ14_PYRYE|nr:hypothetical protein I4F81_005551 [Neopyropia yezoensis]